MKNYSILILQREISEVINLFISDSRAFLFCHSYEEEVATSTVSFTH